MLRIVTLAIVCCASAAASAQESPAKRPLFSRGNLSKLRTLDRAQVFQALGSFDDRGLSDESFIQRAVHVLDPQRVPGLAEACAAGDWDQALAVVYAACRAKAPAPSKLQVSAAKLAEAQEVLENRFSFYGEKHQLPTDIDWDGNACTKHWGHDLNRFTYLHPLIQAYQATHDARYSRKAIDLILDWIAKSEVSRCFRGSPYVWGSYLNNAIHCSRWSRCLQVLIAHEQITPIELLRVLKSLHDQLAYLEIVTNRHRGNWPTIGCSCMLSTLVNLPILRDTDRFADYAARTMVRQIDDQVLPDGVQDELTPHYHRVVVRNLLTTVRALRALDREPHPTIETTLRKMVHYVQQTTVPDGSKQVAFNDSDPGSPGDLRSELTDLGLDGLLSPEDRLGPEVFPYAGVALLRQRQDQGDLYLAFDAGPYGRSHQHEDRLGFWLFAYGRSLLVDPGRHLYDWSQRSYYQYLRSTTAHSTIRIDDQDQHSAGRRDTWIASKPLDLSWRAGDQEIRASGGYDLGYGGQNQIGVVHRREIVFVRQRCWVVFDVVSGEGEHVIESRFQFAPGRIKVDGNSVQTDYADANLLMKLAATEAFTEIRVEQGQEEPRGGWYSDSYGKIEPAPALSASLRTRLPWRAATLLFPYRGKDTPVVKFEFADRSVRIQHPELDEIIVKCSLP